MPLPEMHNNCVSSTLSVNILNENGHHLQMRMKMKSVVGVFDNVTIPIQLKRYLYHPHPYHYQDDGNAGDSTTNRMPMSNTPLSHDHHHPCHYDDIGEDDNERNTSAFSVECWLYSRTPPSTPRLHFDPCITRLLHCIKLHCIALDCITLDWSWCLLPGADT